VLIVEWNGEPSGFALFFHNFSTFLGCHGLYLEDLFVREQHRGKGIGKVLLVRLAGFRVTGEALRKLAAQSVPPR
jgi:GNAT superfamily N-acetyltransferase